MIFGVGFGGRTFLVTVGIKILLLSHVFSKEIKVSLQLCSNDVENTTNKTNII